MPVILHDAHEALGNHRSASLKNLHEILVCDQQRTGNAIPFVIGTGSQQNILTGLRIQAAMVRGIDKFRKLHVSYLFEKGVSQTSISKKASH
nr:hypothetical protein [Paracoccus liaowanqingii]